MRGEALEQLADYVQEYNRALLDEQNAADRKSKCREAIVAVFQKEHEHEAEVVGMRVTLNTTVRRTINAELAKQIVPSALYAQITEEKLNTTLRVTPLRKA